MTEEELQKLQDGISDFENKIPYNYYEFSILGIIKKKQNSPTFTKLVIVNRWLWMTDESQLRNLFDPLKEELKKDGFIEQSPSILYTNKNKKETIRFLKKLGLKHNENLPNSLAIRKHVII